MEVPYLHKIFHSLDKALTSLETIRHSKDQQEKDNPDIPTDLDVINALFESTELKLFVKFHILILAPLKEATK